MFYVQHGTEPGGPKRNKTLSMPSKCGTEPGGPKRHKTLSMPSNCSQIGRYVTEFW